MSEFAAWRQEVGREWAGHTWEAAGAAGWPSRLLAEAATWAEAPSGVLYVHAAERLDRAFGFAVAVSHAAFRSGHAVAVGRLDELSVPPDPDPSLTRRRREREPLWSAADTHQMFVGEYARALAEASLALLRLPARLWEDAARVLSLVVGERHDQGRPMLVAATIPPAGVVPVLGEWVGWRLGFAHPDGTPVGRATPNAAVLDLDAPPR